MIKSEEVEQVDFFKYLGTVLDKNLKFTDHVDYVYKKANQRMYLLRKLKSFNVDSYILDLVYKSLVQSVLTFNIVTWYGNLGVREKKKLNRIVNLASKIIGIQQQPLSHIYHDFVSRKVKKIVSDESHPLHNSFELMRSGRRFREPKWKRIVYKNSFVPSAVTILNSGKIW